MALGDERKNCLIMPPRGAYLPWDPAPVALNPGVVMTVDDDEISVTAGGLFDLPPEVAGHQRPNSASVVAVGVDVPVKRGTCPPVKVEVVLGDRVLIYPFEGVRWRTLAFRKAQWAARRVRLLGSVVADIPISAKAGRQIEGRSHLAEFEPYHIAMPCKLTDNKIAPIGDWIFIRRDPLQDQQSGFFMSERSRGVNSMGNWKATVVFASDRAIENGYVPGARVVFHAPSTAGELDFTFDGWGLDPPLEDYAFIRWTQCHYVSLGDEEPVRGTAGEGVGA